MAADNPQLNVGNPSSMMVTKGALSFIEKAVMAGRSQTYDMVPSPQSPAMLSLWAEASRWACDALNTTTTTSNQESKSPSGDVAWYPLPLCPGSTSTLPQAWLL